MEKIEIRSVIESFDDPSELTTSEQSLLIAARSAMENAYAPYSRFRVGAAILMENGVVVQGNNQENMAYPSGLCAERVAIFAASAQFPNVSITAIAVTAASMEFPSDHPVAPCGACRQSLLEYEMNQSKPMTLVLRGSTGKVYRVHGIQQLLPLHFREDGLKS